MLYMISPVQQRPQLHQCSRQSCPPTQVATTFSSSVANQKLVHVNCSACQLSNVYALFEFKFSKDTKTNHISSNTKGFVNSFFAYTYSYPLLLTNIVSASQLSKLSYIYDLNQVTFSNDMKTYKIPKNLNIFNKFGCSAPNQQLLIVKLNFIYGFNQFSLSITTSSTNLQNSWNLT